MAWIESHQSLARHRKTLRAAGLLRISRHALIGHLHELWWWGLDNVPPDGCLGDLTDYEIAAAAGWDGDATEFVSALIRAGGDGSGFIEERDGVRYLHDWYDYAGKLLDRRVQEAQRKRSSRSRAKEPQADVAQTSGGCPADVLRTSCGRPADVRPYSTVPYLTNGSTTTETAPATDDVSSGDGPKDEPNQLQEAWGRFKAYLSTTFPPSWTAPAIQHRWLPFLQDMGEQVVRLACEEAAAQGAVDKPAYALAILAAWQTKQVRSPDAAHNLLAEHRKQRGRDRLPGKSQVAKRSNVILRRDRTEADAGHEWLYRKFDEGG